jgi:selenide,water dikinase
LRRLDLPTHPNLLAGTTGNEDAGVYKLSAGLALVNTVDFFTPIVDDPYTFGRIAAANAMSDVYAMGGRPLTVLNIVGFPAGELPHRVLTRILQGGAERASAAGAVVVGGHTISDPDLKYGMAVTGTVHPKRMVRNGGARKGDALVLTKPLGTGIVCSGIKNRQASASEKRASIGSMVALNDTAGLRLYRYNASACTDVTGFGLAGHATEMARASTGVRLELEAARIPLLPGVARLAELGSVTGGSRRTRKHLGRALAIAKGVARAVSEAVVDAQTSGGLLVSLPQGQARGYVRALRRNGVDAVVVGEVHARPASSPVLVAIC